MNRSKRLPQIFHTLAAEHKGSVLLQTSRVDSANRFSYLFLRPRAVLHVAELTAIPKLFDQIETALETGCFVAGFLSYECGYHFESFKTADVPQLDVPLAWFGVYEQAIRYDHETGQISGELPDISADNVEASSNRHLLNRVSLRIEPAAYMRNIERIKEYIAAGDTYQVNFTDRVEGALPAGGMDAFEVLLRQQPVAYSAFLNLAECQIASLSPELFFRIAGDMIYTRPMKGTMPRGLDLQEDQAAQAALKNDVKNRSEHVMIVDLLRNDLGRLCTMGSVQVHDLFNVEKYQSLLQMTSTIAGKLPRHWRYYDVFRSLFPSGSITGAPKLRTMQIIQELEPSPRGAYTGAIGFIAPDRSAVFNVAIRTLVIGDGKFVMGVGGGIIADSDPAMEYDECLLKASFLTRKSPAKTLRETMLWDNGFARLHLHLQRLEESAEYFDFVYSRSSVMSHLQDLARGYDPGKQYRMRLQLTEEGDVRTDSSLLERSRMALRVRVSASTTFSKDVLLRHKTSLRSFYDEQLEEARREGFDEVIFLNEHGEVTEGAISNILIRRDKKLFTPPVTCGLLPGTYRRYLLEERAIAQ
jgi:para-aminobenzoate synthetase/4-amino-4-deoxychorismate lyase